MGNAFGDDFWDNFWAGDWDSIWEHKTGITSTVWTEEVPESSLVSKYDPGNKWLVMTLASRRTPDLEVIDTYDSYGPAFERWCDIDGQTENEFQNLLEGEQMYNSGSDAIPVV